MRIITSLIKRVKAGIAYLNAIRPNWVKEIDLKVLDLSSNTTCVIGELTGDYEDGHEALGLNDDSAVAMGLYSRDKRRYPELTRIWKREIKKLKK